VQVARSSSSRPTAFRPRPSTSSSTIVRPFSSTRFHLQQQQPGAKEEAEPKAEEQAKDKKQQTKEEEPDTTVAGRSPFAAFVEVLREEVRKNREWQDSVKQLGGEVGKVQDSEAMKRAKDAYERARVSCFSLSLSFLETADLTLFLAFCSSQLVSKRTLV
jgi:import inner membrane translocase subunit TIM44